MKYLNPYLIFNGNCRQAMDFYRQCLGGVLYTMSYAEIPGGPGPDFPEANKNWLIHARITLKSLVLMASDAKPGTPVRQGTSAFISVSCESVQEIEDLFKALSERGEVIMPLQETFFALRFGMLTDQFGVQWMLNLEKP